MDCAAVRERLFELGDEQFADFTARLVPTVKRDAIIGVRMPDIEKLAKEMAKLPGIGFFLDDLPHRYHEENILHASLLGALAAKLTLEELIVRIEAFLPYVDNWAVCDALAPKALRKHYKEVYALIPGWLSSESAYTVRFALVTLLTFFVQGDGFEPDMLMRAMTVKSEEYYVRMAQAWYMSYALIWQYESALPLISGNALDKWTHNKSIQKAVESFRVSDAHKAELRSLRRK